MSSTVASPPSDNIKGRLLVLGGTGFLGQTICRRAVLEGYSVTSLSRRGLPPQTTTKSSASEGVSSTKIDYRKGDARKMESIENILKEHDNYIGVVHCIGLLFDDASGLGQYNQFVSGSGSEPEKGADYDSITRLTAFNAIDAATVYAKSKGLQDLPFVFTSAAEAGWPEVSFGPQLENYLAPEWLRRYLKAKREVEAKLLSADAPLRPIIPRPSLIYSMDRPASFLPVGAFFVGNKVGLPFVDRPVTVQSLASAMVRAVSNSETKGILRYPQIDELSQ